MAPVIKEWKNKEYWWNDTDRKTEVLWEKPVPVPLYPLQILKFEMSSRVYCGSIMKQTGV
jgi:hypothetical protein